MRVSVKMLYDLSGRDALTRPVGNLIQRHRDEYIPIDNMFSVV
jgi:hypothetical protein